MRLRHVVLTISLLALLFTGCLMDHMTTARPVGADKVAMTAAWGYAWIPGLFQAGVDIGLSERLDLGFTTGVIIAFWGDSADVYWSGINARIKYALADDPDSVTLAVGGSVEISNPGAAEMQSISAGGSIYIDSNIPFIPLFLSTHPTHLWSLHSEHSSFHLKLAGGLHFDLSDTVRLIIGGSTEIDFSSPDHSFGWGTLGAGFQFLL